MARSSRRPAGSFRAPSGSSAPMLSGSAPPSASGNSAGLKAPVSNGVSASNGMLLVPPRRPLQIAGATGWTAASGGSAQNGAAYTKPHPSGRTTGNVFTKNPVTGTFAGERVTPLVPFKMSDYALVGVDANPQLISGSVTLRVSSDAFATKRMEFSWPLPAEAYAGDWNRLTARTNADGTIDPGGASWVVTGGMTLGETVNSIQISINTAANDAARIDVDSVFGFSAAPVRGVVMFGFDRYEDTSLSALALPIAQKYGITCYAAGDTDKVASQGAAYARVKQLYDAGWSIVSQGPDHKNYVTVPASTGAAQLATDFSASRAVLQSVGLGNALDHFAYPYSANNAATDAALLAAGVRTASTGIGWHAHPNEFNLGFKLVGYGRVNIGPLTLAQVKRLIDRAAIYGVLVDLFCHGLVAGGDGTTPPGGDNLNWYQNDWDTAVAYAKSYASAGIVDIMNPVTLFNARGKLPVAA